MLQLQNIVNISCLVLVIAGPSMKWKSFIHFGNGASRAMSAWSLSIPLRKPNTCQMTSKFIGERSCVAISGSTPFLNYTFSTWTCVREGSLILSQLFLSQLLPKLHQLQVLLSIWSCPLLTLLLFELVLSLCFIRFHPYKE